MPVTWFPEHRGKVIGFVNGGFGLASTVFSPIQSLLVNPDNVSPVTNNSTNSTGDVSSGSYFTDPEVLDNVPSLLLYMSAIYAVILSIGAVLVVEKDPGKEEKVDLKKKLSDSFSFLYHQTFPRLDFYLLWLTRFPSSLSGPGLWRTGRPSPSLSLTTTSWSLLLEVSVVWPTVSQDYVGLRHKDSPLLI